MTRIGGIIFDLDGTLLDTLRDVAEAVNDSLHKYGLPTHDVARYRDFIGGGFSQLIERATPPGVSPEKRQQVLDWARVQYGQHWHVHTRLFPGVDTLLSALQARNIPMAILSNKPHPFTRATADFFLGQWHLDPILGEQDGAPKKPDRAVPLSIAGHWGFSAEQVLFVGDSEIDLETARNAGMPFVAVGWGFRTPEFLLSQGAQHVIGNPLELLPQAGLA